MSKSSKSNWEVRRQIFLTQLIKDTEAKSQLKASFRSPDHRYVQRSSALTGVNYGFVVSEKRTFARTEVYICRDDALENKSIFDHLKSQKLQIETAVGKKLNWQRLNNKIASRISYQDNQADFSTIKNCNQLIASLSDLMVKFENGFEGPLGGITI